MMLGITSLIMDAYHHALNKWHTQSQMRSPIGHKYCEEMCGPKYCEVCGPLLVRPKTLSRLRA